MKPKRPASLLRCGFHSFQRDYLLDQVFYQDLPGPGSMATTVTTSKKDALPELPYKYNALEPTISENIMNLDDTKHHMSYVTGANVSLDRREKARNGQNSENVKGILRDPIFSLSG